MPLVSMEDHSTDGGQPHSGSAAPVPTGKARASFGAWPRHCVAALSETFRGGKAGAKTPVVENAALHPLRVRARKERTETTPPLLHAGPQSHLLPPPLRPPSQLPSHSHRTIAGPQLA